METMVRNHLKATVIGEGIPAALRALHNLFGLSGVEIATSLGRDRTMVQLYLNGKQKMPPSIVKRLRETLQTCITVARTIRTSDASEDELLEAIMQRAEAILGSL